MTDQFPMTEHGKTRLEQELEQLIKVDREKLKIAISEARALGDLKENSEYHSAKEKQSHIEGRIKEIQFRLNNSKVINIKELSGPDIKFGATITLFDVEKEKSIKYQIVGSDEADLKEGKISYSSPLATALIGKQEGDTVIVKAPKGDIEYEIESVQYI